MKHLRFLVIAFAVGRHPLPAINPNRTITGSVPWGLPKGLGGKSDEGTCPVMKSTASLFRVLLAVSMLAGCSSYRPTPPAFHEVLDQPYRLGAGDRVRVSCDKAGGKTLISEITVGLSGDVVGSASLADLIAAAPPTDAGCPGGTVDAVAAHP